MNREQRRHPEKQQEPNPQARRDLDPPTKSPDEESVRAKSSRHKKSTADKWNQ